MLNAQCITFTILLLSLTAYRSRAGKSLRATVDYFNSSILNYSSLVFDPYQDVVYLAARNSLVELNLTSMAPLQVHESKPRKAARELCHRRWKPEGECENFMKIDSVLLNSSSDTVERLRFLVCSSNAYAPYCEIRSALGNGHELFVEDNVFPGNPFEVLNNQVSLVTVQPDREHLAVYSAGVIMADWTSIIKSFDVEKISSSTSTTWLNNPVFVGMHEEEQYILVFFREMALEDRSLRNNIVYSRVARICKADHGAASDPESVFLDEKVWTTFVKARLLCTAQSKPIISERASHTVQYNFLQDVHYDPIARHFVTVFLNKEPRVWGVGGRTLDSAVCTFALHDIEQSFDSRFVHQDSYLDWRLVTKTDSTSCPPASSKINSRSNSSHTQTTHAPQNASFYMFQYSSVQGQLHVTLPATFVQQVVTRSVACGRNCSKSVTYLLDSRALLHTVVEHSVLSPDQVLQLANADCPTRERHKFYEMKLYERSAPNYLVIISDERVIRVSVSACERLLTELDCRNSHCRWISDAAMCLHQPTTADRLPFLVAFAPAPNPAPNALPDEVFESLGNKTVNVFSVLCDDAAADLLVSHHAALRCERAKQRSCSVRAVWNVSTSHQTNVSKSVASSHAVTASEDAVFAQQNLSIHYNCPIRQFSVSVISDVILATASHASTSSRLKFVFPFVSFCAGLLFGVITFILLARLKPNAQSDSCLVAPWIERQSQNASVTPRSRLRSATTPASFHSRLSRYGNPETYRRSLLSATLSLNASIASRSHLSERYLAQSTTDNVLHRETNDQNVLTAPSSTQATSNSFHY